jgi:hypothetical protein
VFYTRQHVTFGGDGKQFLNYLNEKVPNGASIMVLANVNDLNSVQLPYPTEPFAQASYYRLLRVTKTLPSPPGTAR